MQQAEALQRLEIGECRLGVEFDELHHHEGPYEAAGVNNCTLVSDKLEDCILQIAEVVAAAAEPVPCL